MFNISTSVKFLNFLFATALLLLSQGAMANCEIYIANDIYPLINNETSLNATLLDDTSSKDIDTSYMSQILGSQSFLLKKEHRELKIYMSFVDPTVKGWEPVSEVFSLKDINKLNCQTLYQLKKKLYHKRQTSKKLFSSFRHYLKNHFHSAPLDMSLGELILQTEVTKLKSEGHTIEKVDTLINRYRELLHRVNDIKYRRFQNPYQFFRNWKEHVLKQIYNNNGEDINYCKDNSLLSDALSKGCTNCQGETLLFLSLIVDAKLELPQDWGLGFETFKDHIRPILYNKNDHHQIFDLTYGLKDQNRSAVYDFSIFLSSILRGQPGLYHSKEEELIRAFIPEPLVKPKTCLFRTPTFVPLRSRDIIHMGGFYNCTKFSRAEPPEGVIDSQSRIEQTEFTNNNIFTSSYDKLKNSFTSVKSGLGNLLSSALGGFNSNYSLSKDIRNYLDNFEKLSVEDKNFIQPYVESDQINKNDANEIKTYFNVNKVLKKLGIGENILSQLNNIDLSFTVLPIIFPAEITATNNYVYGDFLSTLAFPTSSKEYSRHINLSVEERYIVLFKLYENVITKHLHLMKKIYSNDFNKSLNLQHTHKESLNELRWAVHSYLKLFNQVTHDLKSIDKDLFKNVFKRSFLGGIIDEVKIYRDYLNRVDSRPEEFLKALIHTSTSYRDFEIINDFSNIFQDFYNLSNQRDDKPYHGFVRWFLFNENYFFTGEISDEEKALYGGVRPRESFSFTDWKNQIRHQDESETTPNKVNLPKIEQEGCKEGEVGYVRRGLFYIYCEQNQKSQEGNSNIGKKSATESSNRLDSPIESDTPPEKDSKEIYRVRNEDLIADENALKEIEVGSPHGSESKPDHLIDPRQEVVIDKKHWKLLTKIFKPYSDKIEVQLAVHHLQRKSIQTEVQSGFMSKIYTSSHKTSVINEVKLSPKIVDLEDLNFYIDTINVKTESDKADLISKMVRYYTYRKNLQKKYQMPWVIAEKDFLRVAFNEIDTFGLKRNWKFIDISRVQYVGETVSDYDEACDGFFVGFCYSHIQAGELETHLNQLNYPLLN